MRLAGPALAGLGDGVGVLHARHVAGVRQVQFDCAGNSRQERFSDDTVVGKIAPAGDYQRRDADRAESLGRG